MGTETQHELACRLVRLIDQLLHSGDACQDSLFLKVSFDQLKQLRQECVSVVDQLASPSQPKEEGDAPVGVDHTQYDKKLYILLYQSQGTSMVKWAEALKMLKISSVGRPIYVDEAHVIHALRERGGIGQEGYVCIWAKRSEMVDLPDNLAQHDKWGHALVALKDVNMIDASRIIEFVHASGNRYRFKGGKLSLKDAMGNSV